MGKRSSRRLNRNMENPSHPLNIESPDEETYSAFGGSRSVSGVRVTRRKALGYPAVWRAVSLISGDVAKLPLGVYRQAGRNRELDRLHPSYRLLMRKPNEAMTAFVFKQTIVAHVLTEGNGYAYIDRDGAGNPVGLMLLNPDKTVPVKVKGALWYVYGDDANPKDWQKIPAEDVLHVRGLGFDGLQGYPVLKYAAESLGVAIAARDYSGRYFKNDARPGGALKHPGKLTTASRVNMRESWARLHEGADNRHKIAILEEGVDFIPFQSNAKDAQLLENREFDSREIANIFGVPTHKLGDPSKVAYNSLEQENQSYYDDTLSRWLRVIAEECHDKLLSEEEKANESHLIDFDYQEIQRADINAQVSFVTSLTGAGVINIDEGRAILGMNSQADTAPPEADPDLARTAKPASTNGLRQIVIDTARRMVRRLTVQAERAAKSSAWQTWPTEAAEHIDVIREAFAPVLLACDEAGLVSDHGGDVAAALVRSVIDTLRDLSAGQVPVIVKEIERHAPEQIANKIMGSKA